MATQTSNLGLTKPGYDEAADVVPAVNNNMDAIDAAMGAVPANTSVQAQITANAQAIAKLDESIAIVSNGNTHAAIAAGQYVYIKGHGTLAEGLYTANSAISANATLSNSNVTAVSGGGLNALNSKIAKTDYSISNYIAQNITRMRGQIVKMNNIVFIEGRWEGNATNSDDILILPSELRPSSIMYGSGVIYSSSGLASAEYVINTNGTLRQAQVAGNTTNGSFVFIYVI